MKSLLETINEDIVYSGGNAETNQITRNCDDNTKVLCQTLAICFQALIDKLDEIEESIDPNPINPVYR